MSQLRVLHLITNLNVGGAQSMLVKLLRRMESRSVTSGVVSLQDLGPMSAAINQLRLPTESLDMRSLRSLPSTVCRMGRIISDWQPDVVQTWMYHSNWVGALSAKLSRQPTPVVWNIRMNPPLPGVDKRSTHWVAGHCGKHMRRLAHQCVLNSKVSARGHVELGYPADRLTVIPNGFDTDTIDASPTLRNQWRDQWQVGDGELIIGTVGRFHPHKDYRTFVGAAKRIHDELSSVRFVMCGEGLSADNDELIGWIREANLEDRFILLGRQTDVAGVYSAVDLAVSSSILEGFPNSVGEAMACRVPCAVTNAGGTAELVGNTARIVSCRRPDHLAEECVRVLRFSKEHRRDLGENGRARIIQHFGLDQIAQQYETLWQQVAGTLMPPTSGRKQKAA